MREEKGVKQEDRGANGRKNKSKNGLHTSNNNNYENGYGQRHERGLKNKMDN